MFIIPRIALFVSGLANRPIRPRPSTIKCTDAQILTI